MEISKIPAIGGFSKKGIWSADKEQIGAGDKAQPVLIDLTDELLDPRISYSGPAHFYWNKTGSLALCAENEWPLEYQNGQPAGRHAPEPAAINLIPGTKFEDIGFAGVPRDWIYAGTAAQIIQNADIGLNAVQTSTASTLAAVYSEASSAFIALPEDGGSPAAWTRITRKFTVTDADAGLLRWYISRASSTDYLYGRSADVPAGNYIASVLRRVTTDGVLSAFAQLESGGIATSPIMCPAGATATRIAATVTINTKGYRMIYVRYTGNYGESFPARGNVSELRVAQRAHWGTRYIRQISLSR